MKKVIPIRHFITVEVENPEEVSKGGIIMQVNNERAQYGSTKGRVIDIGKTAFLELGGVEIKVGDMVVFPKYSGLDYKIDKKLFRIIDDEDIKAVEIDEE